MESNLGYLFFLLIPLGIVGFVFVYRIALPLFREKPFLDLPLINQSGDFELPQSGKYTVWGEGNMLSRNLFSKFKPKIVNLETGSVQHLSWSWSGGHVNGFKRSRLLLYTFTAQKGNYRFYVVDGTSLNPFDDVVAKSLGAMFPAAELGAYHFQVRKSGFILKVFAAVWLFLISLGSLICGLVLGLVFTS